jgi:hypothetical protein
MDKLLKQPPSVLPAKHVKQIILSLQDFNGRCGNIIVY